MMEAVSSAYAPAGIRELAGTANDSPSHGDVAPAAIAELPPRADYFRTIIANERAKRWARVRRVAGGICSKLAPFIFIATGAAGYAGYKAVESAVYEDPQLLAKLQAKAKETAQKEAEGAAQPLLEQCRSEAAFHEKLSRNPVVEVAEAARAALNNLTGNDYELVTPLQMVVENDQLRQRIAYEVALSQCLTGAPKISREATFSQQSPSTPPLVAQGSAQIPSSTRKVKR